MSRLKAKLQPMNSDEAWKLQTSYVKARLVWQLANQITALIPEVLINSLIYCSKNYDLVGRGTSTDKENRDRIRRHPRTPPAARELISSH